MRVGHVEYYEHPKDDLSTVHAIPLNLTDDVVAITNTIKSQVNIDGPDDDTRIRLLGYIIFDNPGRRGGLYFHLQEKLVEVVDQYPLTSNVFARTSAGWAKIVPRVLVTLKIDGTWKVYRDIYMIKEDGEEKAYHHRREVEYTIRDGALVNTEVITFVKHGEHFGPS